MELPSFYINNLYSNKIKWKPKTIENVVKVTRGKIYIEKNFHSKIKLLFK